MAYDANVPADNLIISEIPGAIRQNGVDIKSVIDAHTSDTTDAHTASAITNVASGNISATTVQEAVNELDTEKVNVSDVVTAAVANKIVKLDSNAKLPASITGNAETASSATKLMNARTISLVGTITGQGSFDGTSDVAITVFCPYFSLFKTFVMQATSNAEASLTSLYNPFTNSSMNLAVSLSTVGVNGLDAGSVAGNTWYHIFTIYNPTTTTLACIASTNASCPTLPLGYTQYCRMGSLYTNASGSLYRTIQRGRSTQYVLDGTVLTAMRLVAQGALGTYSDTAPSWYAASVSSFVPPTAAKINLSVNNYYEGGSTQTILIAPNSNYAGRANSSGNFPPFHFIGAIGGAVFNLSLLLETTNIYVATSGSHCAIGVLGWDDNL